MPLTVDEADSLEAEIRAILVGIDQDEARTPDGWWETSIGIAFGEGRLAAVLDAVRSRSNG